MGVEIEQPEAAHHLHPRGRYTALVPLLALLISLVSIAVAYHHGKVMEALVHQNERLVQANSLPFLQLFGSNVGEDGRPRIAFGVSNEGVGPPHIRALRVSVDGKAVRSLSDLMRSCCGSGRGDMSTSTLMGRMIRPGQVVWYIQGDVTSKDEAALRLLDKARQSDRVTTDACYCSVFNECWVRSSGDTTKSLPQRVDACPADWILYTE